jgi:1,4-alpha-glucan branching enzyme
MLNSDAQEYGGSGHGNLGGVESVPVSCHGMHQSIAITVPPLGMIVFRRC